MAKNPCVRTLMDSQHVKRSKALPKSAQQSFCQIFWELWKKISSKISMLVVSEISRLFVNILTPNENYSLSIKASVWRNQFKCNYQKSKNICCVFFFISEIYRKFSLLWTKRLVSQVIYFWNYRLQK